MAITIDVERQRFVFGERWIAAFKYDDSDVYRKGPEKLKGSIDGVAQSTRAVDIVALDVRGRLLLLEVKDFRGHRIENKPRISTGELALETALKVRDSIAGLVGAATQTHDAAVFGDLRRALCCSDARTLTVMLWLEDDLQRTEGDAKRQLNVQRDTLKKHLHWLHNARVTAHSSRTSLYGFDLSVSNLAGVGR